MVMKPGTLAKTDIKPEVKLFKQSYQQFASGGLEERLEPLGIVVSILFDHTESDGKYRPIKTIMGLNSNLAEQAEGMSATHIFGVEYSISPKDGNERMATGDAYGPAKNKGGPYR